MFKYYINFSNFDIRENRTKDEIMRVMFASIDKISFAFD